MHWLHLLLSSAASLLYKWRHSSPQVAVKSIEDANLITFRAGAMSPCSDRLIEVHCTRATISRRRWQARGAVSRCTARQSWKTI